MELKFRAWDDGRMILYSDCTQSELPYLQTMFFFQSIREDAILMQYTGFKDDSGTDCYEGDITDDGRIIVWENGAFWLKLINGESSFPLHFLSNGRLDRMIIGNKFQNPELIK